MSEKEKKRLITPKRIIILLILYIALGCILPFYYNPPLNEEFTSSFDTSDYYSDTLGSERVQCIDDNTDALIWRLRLIESAQEEIIFSSFDMRHDSAGIDMMAALYDAADRGVKVKLIIDGVSATFRLGLSDSLKTLASHPNVEAKKYNPVTIIKPWKNMLRLHDKYLIADDNAYILGGRNANDLFLGDYSSRASIDRDLLVYLDDPGKENASIDQLKEYFSIIWQDPDTKAFRGRYKDKADEALTSHYDELRELYPQGFEDFIWEEETIAANKVSLLTNPTRAKNKSPEIWHMLSGLMAEGEDVIIQTPYIVCNSDMYSDLTKISDSADSLSIITNAVEGGDNPWGCVDYLNQNKKIRATGAEVYEYLGTNSTHSKCIFIDDRMSIIGSFNLDMRSVYLDTELMLAVDCPQLNESLRRNLDDDFSRCRSVDEDGNTQYGDNWQDQDMGIVKKGIYSLLRIIILPIRHLL